MCAPQSGPPRDVHVVIQRREEGGRRQRWPGGEEEESNGESQMKLVITSLCVLHSLDRSEIFMELYREEESEEVDRAGQEDKRGK